MPKSFMGVLPAAGMGTRLHPLRPPKEVLPIAFLADPDTGTVKPLLAAEYSLYAMKKADVFRCIVVINEQKTEIIKYLGNGSEYKMHLAYLNQPQPLGLAAAVAMAVDWALDSNICLALPDTVFYPQEAISEVTAELLSSGVDLVLGVFPTDSPEQLGPVRISCVNRVVEVLDKPSSTDLRNTWGVAAWTPRFSQLLTRPLSKVYGKSIGHIFHEAVTKGLEVRAVQFESGHYADLGTGPNYAAMIFGEWSERCEKELLVCRTRCGGVG